MTYTNPPPPPAHDEPTAASVTRIDPLWTQQDVADYLQFTTRTVRNMMRDGELPFRMVRSKPRFVPAEIRALFESSGDPDSTLEDPPTHPATGTDGERLHPEGSRRRV